MTNNSFVVQVTFKDIAILETSNKSVWSNIIWYVKACILWKYIQYTIHLDKTQILKKLPSD